MSYQDIIAHLVSYLQERHISVRVLPLSYLEESHEAIESPHRQGLLDPVLYRKWLEEFVFRPPDQLPGARSLILAAVPQPQMRVTFEWQGAPFQAIVPPTYLHQDTDALERTVAQILGAEGFHLARVSLPLKLLAVRSGLAAYGKNNIAYVEGMGSFHRLAVFYTDLPANGDTWQEPRLLEACRRCRACLKACPTQAITADRFLLHAERCLTFLNEQPDAFPAWVDPAWHNCLVGCMKCQTLCPENRPFVGWIEQGARFSEEETGLLLRGAPADQWPSLLVKKLEEMYLLEYTDFLGRNLRALMDQKANRD